MPLFVMLQCTPKSGTDIQTAPAERQHASIIISNFRRDVMNHLIRVHLLVEPFCRGDAATVTQIIISYSSQQRLLLCITTSEVIG